MAHLHAQGRLHTMRLDSLGVGKVADVLQRACDDPTLKVWISSY